MLVFSQNLSQSLSRAIAQAEQQGYEVATPEHVLLALLDDPDAIPVMRACNVDFEKLQDAVLATMPHSDYLLDPDDSDDALDANELDETLDSDESDEAPDEVEGIPIEHFQVALELAVHHAKTSGCEEVDSGDVLTSRPSSVTGSARMRRRRRVVTSWTGRSLMLYPATKKTRRYSRSSSWTITIRRWIS